MIQEFATNLSKMRVLEEQVAKTKGGKMHHAKSGRYIIDLFNILSKIGQNAKASKTGREFVVLQPMKMLILKSHQSSQRELSEITERVKNLRKPKQIAKRKAKRPRK